MHENGGDVPNEDPLIDMLQFASDHFMGSYPVPSYGRWLARADFAPVFRAHRRFLQLLQWRCPGDRWVLKSPSYLGEAAELLRRVSRRVRGADASRSAEGAALAREPHGDAALDAQRHRRRRRGREDRRARDRDRNGLRDAVARRRHDSRRPDHRRAVRRARRRSVAHVAHAVRTHRHRRSRPKPSSACARTSRRGPASGTAATSTTSPTPASTSTRPAPGSRRTRIGTTSLRSCERVALTGSSPAREPKRGPGDGPSGRRGGERSVRRRAACTGSSVGHGQPPKPVAR